MARRCSAALCLLGVFATPARALDFVPCDEPGHAAFDCATLPVDRNGGFPAQSTSTSSGGEDRRRISPCWSRSTAGRAQRTVSRHRVTTPAWYHEYHAG
jgi:hypothetical protein